NDMLVLEQCDPLVVVATSRRGEPSDPVAGGLGRSSESERSRVQIPDRSSYHDWADSRPLPRTWTSWRYVVELRDLSADEVISVVHGPRLTSMRHLGPFVHRLTNGHPWAVRVVLDAIESAQRTEARSPDLRCVLGLPTAPDATGPAKTVGARVRDYLLR